MKKVGHQPFPPIFHRKRKAAISRRIVAHRPKYKIMEEEKYFKRKTETEQYISTKNNY